MTSIAGDSADPNVPGVHGSHSSTGAGVFGESEIGPGVHAVSRGTDPNQEGVAVFAEAVGAAVIGNSQNWIGVVGFTTSTTGGVGVMGQGAGLATGVFGEAASARIRHSPCWMALRHRWVIAIRRACSTSPSVSARLADLPVVLAAVVG
jgi:hypothetical protein